MRKSAWKLSNHLIRLFTQRTKLWRTVNREFEFLPTQMCLRVNGESFWVKSNHWKSCHLCANGWTLWITSGGGFIRFFIRSMLQCSISDFCFYQACGTNDISLCIRQKLYLKFPLHFNIMKYSLTWYDFLALKKSVHFLSDKLKQFTLFSF